MAKAKSPNSDIARNYADQLILETLTELYEVVKPSEIAEKLQPQGLGLSAIRSLLSSNPDRFAYAERRWVPASRVETQGRPFAHALKRMLQSYGAPMPLNLVVTELSRTFEQDEEVAEQTVRRLGASDPTFFITRDDKVGVDTFVFRATDESVERALLDNEITSEDVDIVEKALGNFDWRDPDAIVNALEKVSPVNAIALGCAAWKSLNPQDPRSVHLYDWKTFNAEMLSVPGFIMNSDRVIYPESEAKGWISAAVKLSDKLESVIEVEDAVPLEYKKEDIQACIKEIVSSDESLSAIKMLEDRFEVTPQVKTFPDDLENLMNALKADSSVWWVGGDRFRKPKTAPDFINEVPAPLEFVQTEFKQEDGTYVDCELTDEGLSSSLRKLIVHPLATDVLDEELIPAPKNMPDTLRLVLKPIHREMGTFPLSQFPTGFFNTDPGVQELILVDSSGNELQAWMNHECRLIFNLFDWWLEQPVESGAVFQLTKTKRPNVLEFEWLDQTDPVVYISNQRMEELREISGRAPEMSTFDILREVMTHWPKGADFLTVLWELNVVRRTSRRMLASLLSSYVCFYQRSGSPVWHYDHKKVEQGFDKTKKKFIQ